MTLQAHNQQDDFKAIIVDWIMPDMDGLETIRQIRNEVGDATPIVLLSAYDWTDIEEEATAAGVSAFIAKPLFKSRLYHVLRNVCFNYEEFKVPKRHKRDKPLVEGRVLLVEDNELNLEIAKELIEQYGAEVELATDGLEALNKIDAAPEGYFSLIFMDWQMPRMNGIEATINIIEHEKVQHKAHTPIVAMTANAFNEDKEHALNVGMDGFMTKPIDMSELEYNLRTYLKIRMPGDISESTDVKPVDDDDESAPDND